MDRNTKLILLLYKYKHFFYTSALFMHLDWDQTRQELHKVQNDV